MHGSKEGLYAAVLDNGILVDYASQLHDPDQPGQVQPGAVMGNIYKGKVVNVLPGMQAAFLDIGLSKNAFLYIDDALHPNLEKREKQSAGKPSIRDVLRPGQELVVQVVREPGGGKGARVTTHISLPGRWLVYMPEAAYVGVSRKIGDEQERERLRIVGERIRQPEEGVIMRTAADGLPDDALADDASSLRELWQAVSEEASQKKAPAVLHLEAGLVHRVIRDMLAADIEEVIVSDRQLYKQVGSLVHAMAPGREKLVRCYEARDNLFDHFGISRQAEQALSRTIQLVSGGYIVWDQTEALTVIDVNTGRFIGSDNLEETIYRTNAEAAELIARLLRVRDAGGIIIIDFIDMESDANRQRISQQMEALTRMDRSRCTVVGWTRLGLLEITRKKSRLKALPSAVTTCSSCGGRGLLPQ
ncbi:Rne/Rng family ribonuclease (plasmid) [Paenibacillus cellulosilyticus]|nr:Rne/Rng family ribonuclease [Paenibacillus cellulosilyticus]